MMRKSMLLVLVILPVFTIPISVTVSGVYTADAGTTGNFYAYPDPDKYNYYPGQIFLLDVVNLSKSYYYSLVIGADHAAGEIKYINFTATNSKMSISFRYFDAGQTFLNASGSDTFTYYRLKIVLYGAAGDSDTSGTLLDTIHLNIRHITYENSLLDTLILVILLLLLVVNTGIIILKKFL